MKAVSFYEYNFVFVIKFKQNSFYNSILYKDSSALSLSCVSHKAIVLEKIIPYSPLLFSKANTYENVKLICVFCIISSCIIYKEKSLILIQNRSNFVMFLNYRIKLASFALACVLVMLWRVKGSIFNNYVLKIRLIM